MHTHIQIIVHLCAVYVSKPTCAYVNIKVIHTYKWHKINQNGATFVATLLDFVLYFILFWSKIYILCSTENIFQILIIQICVWLIIL